MLRVLQSVKSFALGSLPSTPGKDIWGKQTCSSAAFAAHTPFTHSTSARASLGNKTPLPCVGTNDETWWSGSEGNLPSCPSYTLMLPWHFEVAVLQSLCTGRKLSQDGRQWETKDGNANAGTNKGMRGDAATFPMNHSSWLHPPEKGRSMHLHTCRSIQGLWRQAEQSSLPAAVYPGGCNTSRGKRCWNMKCNLKGVFELLWVPWCMERHSWHLQIQVLYLLFSFLTPVCKAILFPSSTEEEDTGHRGGHCTGLSFVGLT